MNRHALGWITALLLALSPMAAADDAIVNALPNASFEQKAELMTQWLTQDPAAAQRASQLMLDGALYYDKRNGTLYQVADHRKGATALTLDGQSTVTIDKKRQFKRVSLNNDLRDQLRTELALLSLSNDDPAIRLGSIEQLLQTPSARATAAIQLAAEREGNANIQEKMRLALAISGLASSEPEARAAAVTSLSDSVSNDALNALRLISPDDALYADAQRGVVAIERAHQRYQWAETLYFGISLGSVLVLAAIGLAITFGVMGVINMAHGELIMLGAYTTFVMQQLMPASPGLALLLSIPAAFVVAAAVGICIERGVIRFLYGRPLETLLATFGISLILQQAVRSVFSPLNRSVTTPEWMSGAWEINAALSLTLNRLYVIGFCLLVFFALLTILKRSSLGLQVRAVAQNRTMARAMGVRSQWVDALTFGLGSGVAGLAGVALSQLTNVGPNMGQAYIIDSFMVVVFGGVGNLWGTLVAGLSLGIANKLIEPWTGAVLAKIVVLIFIVLFIQKNPRGLFPQRGRAVEG
ncbi:urea ABC transporter permease subunit UrtB [Litorivicinus lipolyticus]|uniref:urea ABC transporter permease subunit UrtB n=1 Tax=Litorivicinus lipolyticus TaxID=418701 RepID=UPI003B5AD204